MDLHTDCDYCHARAVMRVEVWRDGTRIGVLGYACIKRDHQDELMQAWEGKPVEYLRIYSLTEKPLTITPST